VVPMPKLTLSVGGLACASAEVAKNNAANTSAATTNRSRSKRRLRIAIMDFDNWYSVLADSRKRINYSPFAKLVDVERHRSPLARNRSTHRRKSVVIIEIPERRDTPADEFVFGHSSSPLRHLVTDS